MSIVLAVITDGRDYCIEQTIPSALEHLHGPITSRVIYDDSGNPDHAEQLRDQFPHFTVLGGDQRRGFGGAIQHIWRLLQIDATEPHVFHLEDDFTFNRNVDLGAMIQTLDRHPKLAQMVLRRQPWNDDERAAGGIVEQHPDDYAEVWDADLVWLEHSRFFSTNPCLYRRELMLRGWPDGAHSEGRFGIDLVRDGYRFGYWGRREDVPWVTHIGHERAGIGY